MGRMTAVFDTVGFRGKVPTAKLVNVVDVDGKCIKNAIRTLVMYAVMLIFNMYKGWSGTFVLPVSI